MTIIALLAPLVFFTSGAEAKDSDTKCPSTNIVFSGKITEETIGWFEEHVVSCLHEKDGPTITLYINDAIGGYIEYWDKSRWVGDKWIREGLTRPTDTIIEKLQEAPGYERLVTVATRGKKKISVRSAAVKIYMAAKRRIIGCEGYLKPHFVEFYDETIFNGKSEEMRQKLEEHRKKLRDQYTDFLLDQAAAHVQRSEIEELIRKNEKIGWKKALDLGLAHDTPAGCEVVKGAHELRSAGTTFKRTVRQ